MQSAVGSSHGAIAYKEGVSLAELGYVFFGWEDWDVGRGGEVVAHPSVLGRVRGDEGRCDWVERAMIITMKLMGFGQRSRNVTVDGRSAQHFVIEQYEEGNGKCHGDALPG